VAQPTLAELRARRAQECRLTKDRALGTLDDAEAFLRDRRLLTQTQDSSLPSLFAATHEAPYALGKAGFGSWPKTKWPWGAELASRPHIQPVKVHKGKLLLFSAEGAAVIDPLCRDAIARAEDGELGAEAAAILRHLKSAGPSAAEDVKNELALETKAFRAAREKLEREGALVSRSSEGGTPGSGEARSGRTEQPAVHRHGSTLARWDQSFTQRRKAPLERALDDVILLGIRAAVVVQEDEPLGWFTWEVPRDTVRRLLATGKLVRPAAGWVGFP
jgi:hypothetical protein